MFKIDRRLIQNFDWLTLSIVIVISVIGILTIFSATRQPAAGDAAQASFYMKQMVWLVNQHPGPDSLCQLRLHLARQDSASCLCNRH